MALNVDEEVGCLEDKMKGQDERAAILAML
jgi:hypothetical protein